MEKLYRYKFQFFGRVQGVGFRYTCYHAANSVGATGWVKNEWDGSVLMEIQGTQAQIGQVLKMLGNGMFIEIDRTEKTELAVRENEGSFSVR